MGAGFMRCPDCGYEFMWSTWNGYVVTGFHKEGCTKPKLEYFDPVSQVTKGDKS